MIFLAAGVNVCHAPGVLSASSRRPALDEQAIRAFLATDYPKLVGALALMSGSRAAAEDAMCEALARAWERGERGERIESPRAWVTTVAVNLLRSGFRRFVAEQRARGRLRAVPQDAAQTSAEDLVDVRRALVRLPRRQREATVLRYYLDLSVGQVAAAMGVSEGTAKTLLFRARQSLMPLLGVDEASEATERG